jgi:23S rRNA (cytidine2498-2'-O)-methyltransferase
VTGIILHVRQGFEDDAAKELIDHLNQIGISETIPMISQTDSALVVASLSVNALAKARANLKFCDLVFARQLLWSSGKVNLPISGDRITPLIDCIRDILLPMSGSNAFSGVNFETPDTDSSKELSGFCKSLTRPLERRKAPLGSRLPVYSLQ